jgi:hypothetical protein
MTIHKPFDFSLLAIATLLVIQAGIASYGLGFVGDLAATTRAELTTVARAVR